MVTNVLCAIIKSNDTIFNISQMYKHCQKSITGDIAYTIFFYDPKIQIHPENLRKYFLRV